MPSRVVSMESGTQTRLYENPSQFEAAAVSEIQTYPFIGGGYFPATLAVLTLIFGGGFFLI